MILPLNPSWSIPGVEAPEELPFEVDFTPESTAIQFITERELKVWGNARNLALIGDCPFRNLNDGVAAVIPHYGLDFELQSRGNVRQFLYLDLVTFMPLNEYDDSLASGYCRPSLNGKISHTHQSGFDMPIVHWLEVRINGVKAGLYYMGGGAFLLTPLVIPIEREHIKQGRIHVQLVPSTENGFFAIWDAFISTHPPGN